MSKYVQHATDLFAYLNDRPDGEISSRIMEDLDLSHNQFHLAVQTIRRNLSAYGLALTSVPTGSYGGWLYRVVEPIVTAEIEPWTEIRKVDIDTRLKTVEDTFALQVAAVDGRTPNGKAVRRMLRTVTFLRAELADID